MHETATTNNYQKISQFPELDFSTESGVNSTQAILKDYPEFVSKSENGVLSVNYNGLVPALIEQTRGLISKVDSLQHSMDENNGNALHFRLLLCMYNGLIIITLALLEALIKHFKITKKLSQSDAGDFPFLNSMNSNVEDFCYANSVGEFDF